jgi:hypothetical protein
MVAVDLSVGWQFDLIVGGVLVVVAVIAAVVWANTGGRR